MKDKLDIWYAPSFLKEFKKLSSQIKRKAIQKESVFKQDPFAASLKTHKLRGELSDCWSFSINYQYRIVFKFVEENKVLLVSVGTHEVYKK